MEPIFDFDRFSQLAHEDPMAFETQRQALFAAALDEMPPSVQGAARACLAEVQVRMLTARTPAVCRRYSSASTPKSSASGRAMAPSL